VCTLDLKAGEAAIPIELASSLGEEGCEDRETANLRKKQGRCHYKACQILELHTMIHVSCHSHACGNQNRADTLI
jgi:hypothetical protein